MSDVTNFRDQSNILPNDMLSPIFMDEVIRRRNTLEHTETVAKAYIGREFFPFRDFPERRILWESVQDQTVNDLAGIYAWKDRALVKSDDRTWDTHFAELVVVKAARTLDPDIVTKVRDPGMLAVYKAGGSAFAVQAWRQRVADHISKRLQWMDDAVNAVNEYFAWSAILGTLVWPPRDASGAAIVNPPSWWNPEAKMIIRFPFHAPFHQKASTLSGELNVSGVPETSDGLTWDDPNANIIEQLDLIANFMLSEKNIDANDAELIMSRKLFRKLQYNELFLKYLVGGAVTAGAAANFQQSGARNFIPPMAVKDFIESRLGFAIRLYDAKWTYPDPQPDLPEKTKTVRFLPDNLVVIKPREARFGWMAQAPHENSQGQWATGKHAFVYRDPRPPYEREMGLTWIGFPILQHCDEHFILDALN